MTTKRLVQTVSFIVKLTTRLHRLSSWLGSKSQGQH